MVEVVGRFTLHGTERQNASVRAMAKKATEKYGDRLAKNIDVRFLPASQMPARADGGASVGFTPSFREIDMWARVSRYPVEETFAHEVGHALPMSRRQKREVEALATPTGGRWNAPGYADDIRESGALAQSRAVLGVSNPPYKRFYNHQIDASMDAALAEVYLTKPAEFDVEPDPVPPQPTPADPIALQARIDELEDEVEAKDAAIATLQQQLADERAAHDETREQLAVATSRITAKDKHMEEGLAI